MSGLRTNQIRHMHPRVLHGFCIPINKDGFMLLFFFFFLIIAFFIIQLRRWSFLPSGHLDKTLVVLRLPLVTRWTFRGVTCVPSLQLFRLQQSTTLPTIALGLANTQSLLSSPSSVHFMKLAMICQTLAPEKLTMAVWAITAGSGTRWTLALALTTTGAFFAFTAMTAELVMGKGFVALQTVATFTKEIW